MGWIRHLLWIPVAVLSCIAVALISLSVPATRDWVRTRVNGALEDLFVGRVVIDRIGTLRLDLLAGVDAHVLDANGTRILRVDGLRLRSNWPSILRDVVLGRPLQIVLTPLAIDHVEVRLIGDAKGNPTLFSTFTSRKPSSPSKGTPVSVAVSEIGIRHISGSTAAFLHNPSLTASSPSSGGRFRATRTSST
ncbi:MAG: hypothetical protein QM784_08335 [Polyangiaceae bacterium]